jgi:hypothetical protein
MSYKYFVIAALTALSASACASVPQSQAQAPATPAAATCEMKPERKVASCEPSSASSEVEKSSDQATSSRWSREAFHHGSRLGN